MKQLDLINYNKEINNKTYLYYCSITIGFGPCRVSPSEWTWSNDKKELIKHFKEVFLNNVLKELSDDELIVTVENIRKLEETTKYKNNNKKRFYEKMMVLIENLDNQDDLNTKNYIAKIIYFLNILGCKCEAYFYNNYFEALTLVMKHGGSIYEDNLIKTFKEDANL